MDAERDPRIGSVIEGRYRIDASMASGSMGVVYRGERVPVGKLVAIKFLHAAFATDPEFLQRFERETRVLSKLAHPHCVSVVDFGVSEGAPYLVMDFVAGTTLRDLLDDGPLASARALALTRQVLAGLAHAHDQGIVHRDIKPANLMITEEIGTGEHVRILDSGLARLRDAGVNATQAHILVGTPSYMAPEQTMGARVDARADIYAVGVVLFEMLTGERPFTADDTAELLAQHRSAAIPRLAEHLPPNSAAPPGLQRVLDRALAKDPDRRFQSAIEFAAALDNLGELARRQTSVVMEPRSSRGIRFGTWILLLASVVVAASVWFLTREPAPRAPSEPAMAAVTYDAAPRAVPVDAAPARPPADAAVVTVSDAEPDPTTADDPDPEGEKVAAGTEADEDEAEDAPLEIIEDDAPPAPPHASLARNVTDAVKLIKQGKRELALQSLRALWKTHRSSSYIPFLLGNLYFDKYWWSVALDRYRTAIAQNKQYRWNRTVNRNTIRMLSNKKTSGKAAWFLRKTIGKPARPFLKWAAKHDPNRNVRARCATLLRQIR